jgi:hypothetical protein
MCPPLVCIIYVSSGGFPLLLLGSQCVLYILGFLWSKYLIGRAPLGVWYILTSLANHVSPPSSPGLT